MRSVCECSESCVRLACFHPKKTMDDLACVVCGKPVLGPDDCYFHRTVYGACPSAANWASFRCAHVACVDDKPQQKTVDDGK